MYIPALDGREEAKERNKARWAMYMQDVQYVAIVGKGGEKGLLLASSSSFLARPPPRSIGLTSTEKREREGRIERPCSKHTKSGTELISSRAKQKYILRENFLYMNCPYYVHASRP